MASLFVSDLHLESAAMWAVDTFVAFLRGPARAASRLYILGDLYEAWVGDDQLDDPGSMEAHVTRELAQLTASGTTCYLLHGNRDFLLGARFTVADLSLAMITRWSRWMTPPGFSRPQVRRHVDAVAARPAYQRMLEQEGIQALG